MASYLKLVKAAQAPLEGLAELLTNLGAGESGFGGTRFGAGEISLEEQLQSFVEQTDPKLVEPGKVPQTTFFALNHDCVVVGMVRVRHYLTDALRYKGGLIGYYIAPKFRGNGYAKAALKLALAELRSLGEKRALITVDSDNRASIKTIESCGGALESESVDESTGAEFRRYWIELQ